MSITGMIIFALYIIAAAGFSWGVGSGVSVLLMDVTDGALAIGAFAGIMTFLLAFILAVGHFHG